MRRGRWLSVCAAVLLVAAASTQAASPPPIVPPPGIHMQKVGDPVAMPAITAVLVGRDRIYVVTNGMPPWIVAVDEEGRVLAAQKIPEGYNAWALAEAPDGTVYTATTSDIAKHKGYLWAWRPGGTLRLAAVLPDVITVWALAVDPATQLVYIGAHKNLLSYDPATRTVRSLGMPVPGEVDVHALLATPSALYVGLTPNAEVVALDPRTGTVDASFTNHRTSGVKAIAVAPDGSVVVAWGSQALDVYQDGSPVGYLNHAVAAPLWVGGTMYTFQGDGTVAIGVYHTWRNPPVLLHPSPDFAAWGANLDAAGVLSGSLVAVFSNGSIYRLDPTSDNASVAAVQFVNPSPGIIHALAAAPGGSLWASVYLGGEVTHITGTTFDRLPFPFQADAFAFLGHTMYIGAYPGAFLYAYDTTKPWRFGQNPILIGHVQLPGTPQQDRTFALAAGPAGVYVGTIPESGTLDGNLASYNPETGAFQVFDSPIPGEGITSLVFAANGLLVGTTTALGGGDATPERTSGGIFIWNPATQSLVKTIVPVPGMPVWGGLVSTPYGVFGANPRAVFRLDPATLQVDARVFNPSGPEGRWGSLTHMFFWHGKLFLLTEGQLYMVDPKTLAVTKLFFGAEQGAVSGDFLYLSYHESVELVKVPLARLTPENCVYPPHYIEWMDQHPNLIP